jgi:hypothetical protein
VEVGLGARSGRASRLAALAAAVAFGGPPAASGGGEAARERARVGAFTLGLRDCVVEVARDGREKVDLPLGLPGECSFVRAQSGQVQTVETARGTTVLVVSARPLPGSRFCDTRIQALVIRPGAVHASRDEQRIRCCSRGPQDELMFRVLADSARID